MNPRPPHYFLVTMTALIIWLIGVMFTEGFLDYIYEETSEGQTEKAWQVQLLAVVLWPFLLGGFLASEMIEREKEAKND